MGFGTVVATGISIILLLLTAYVLLVGFSGAIDAMTYSIKEVQNMKNDQLKTEVELTNIVTSGHNITFELKNSGNIRITNFTMMDMILTFNRTLEDDTKTTYWLPYRSVPAVEENAWTETSIYPDMINPGMLDPGETLYGRAYINDELWPGSLGWMSITTQNGVSGSSYFNVTM
ncbi:hypothetical protein CUJ83_13640 [Methanocella sp. CWC-04]|uniref:Flagellar protein FlaF n=1 Tax=Methanooceanicella nereidis TaxID=2052831 RepID=A0AAP2RE71_9EURY|nr:hypothetical protein [Methanocella sp. CWC-04]MCD1296041.1 hypothetical protein [Methanocella sp. CWC-04]